MHDVEHKGRTLHLLKSSSKPVPQQRKRRKVEILGTFDQYKTQKEEFKQSDSASEVAMSQRHSVQKEIIDPNKSHSSLNNPTPNIISNVEDTPTLQFVPAQAYSPLNNLNKED